MSGVCWIASYPKSGNTWLRAMLTAYINPEEPLDLNRLLGFNDLDNVEVLSELTGVDAALLSPAELAGVRARVFAAENQAAGTSLRFMKTHLANTVVSPATGSLFGSGKAIYLVRHPYDVAISYTHYVAMSTDDIVRLMCSAETVLDRPDKDRPNVSGQPMLSWAGHVDSWTLEPAISVLSLRYEDMVSEPAAALEEAASFLGLEASTYALDHAIAATAFNRLRTQEESSGFAEKAGQADRFFRSGTVGEGRALLSEQQRQQLIESADNVMERFNYSF